MVKFAWHYQLMQKYEIILNVPIISYFFINMCNMKEGTI